MAYTTIKKPSDYFDGKIYLGSASAVTVTGLNFQPDLVWVKDRDNGNNHCLVDAVRGAGKYLLPDTGAIETDNATNSISAFNSDGFTTGTANPANEAASTTKGFMSWNWLVSNTSGSSNTDGSITSNVAANTTSGISIVTYTGTGANATVGHGLDVAPKVVLCKTLDTTGQSWTMYHAGIGATKELRLDTTGAAGTSSTRWQDTDPTANVFYVGTEPAVNYASARLVAYCFAEKQGFSKFGSYTGNGNADGPFIYTGFKPAFLIWKNTSSISNWFLVDNKRDTFNITDAALFPDSNAVESDGGGSFNGVDFLSNGIKVRQSNGDINASGATFIYMAFAEEPLVGDNPATAR